jgi:hypothetical protein
MIITLILGILARLRGLNEADFFEVLVQFVGTKKMTQVEGEGAKRSRGDRNPSQTPADPRKWGFWSFSAGGDPLDGGCRDPQPKPRGPLASANR